jgi:hypothetical protein
MPIIFITLSETYSQKIKGYGFETYQIKFKIMFLIQINKRIIFHHPIVYVLWMVE